jgi:hypothetical protein
MLQSHEAVINKESHPERLKEMKNRFTGSAKTKMGQAQPT